jgi:hypothetical protein
MTITNGYCTLADIKNTINSLGMNTDPIDDAVIERLVESASRYIDDATNRRFYVNSVDETRYYQSNNYIRCFVDDLVSVTTLSVDVDMDRVYETSFTTADYDLCPDNATILGEPYTYIQAVPLRINGRYFPKHPKGVKIVGKFGYPAVPGQIKEACIQIVTNLYQARRGVGAEGVATITGAGVVITPKDVSKFAQAIIDNNTKYWAK